MEHALVDDSRVLLREHHARVTQAVQPRDRLRGLKRLACRVFLRGRVTTVERAAPIDKELNARFAV